MKAKTFTISIAAALLVGLISGIFIHRGYVLKHSSPVQCDTVTVWMTTEVSHPEPIESHVGKTPISLPAERFTRSAADSTLLEALPDMVTFRDSLDNGTKYTAVLSGIKPSIEALSISYPQRTITKSVPAPYKGWMLSATADIGAYAAPQISVATKAALEVSYNTGPLHVALQGGIISTPTSGSWRPSPYIGARLTVDIYRFR